jgi:hypothetical protein
VNLKIACRWHNCSYEKVVIPQFLIIAKPGLDFVLAERGMELFAVDKLDYKYSESKK